MSESTSAASRRWWQRLGFPVYWTTLKKIANSKLAKYTIAIPVVGWLLVYNDNIILLLEELLDREIEITISWRLHVFYIGLALISVTAILYIIFCPREIDHYADSQDFIAREVSIYTPEYDAKMAERLSEEAITWALPSDAYRLQDGSFPLDERVRVNEEKIVDRLAKLYESANTSHRFVRATSITLFVAGSLLIAAPTITTLTWSACQSVNSLPGTTLGKLQNACAAYLHSGEDVLEDVQ